MSSTLRTGPIFQLIYDMDILRLGAKLTGIQIQVCSRSLPTVKAKILNLRYISKGPTIDSIKYSTGFYQNQGN